MNRAGELPLAVASLCLRRRPGRPRKVSALARRSFTRREPRERPIEGDVAVMGRRAYG
jgi:hypothetical protein